MFAVDRLAGILGVGAFFLIVSVMSRKIDVRFRSWSTWSLVAFVVSARTGYIINNFSTFCTEPLRMLNVWDGGLLWPIGMLAVAVVSLVYLRGVRLIAWSVLPIVIGAVVSATSLVLLATNNSAELPASPFRLSDGRAIVPAELRGAPLVINFWATWCPPCRRELPMMADYAHDPNRVAFLFANQGESDAIVQKFLSSQGIWLDTIIMDSSSELSRNYSVLGLPTTIFIDAAGRVNSIHVGEISKEALVEGVKRLSSAQK
jgi:thiol-disulfide isomerase/thioredoxin